MSKFKHLRRAVQILRDHHEEEITEECDKWGQWTWNLKNWTIQFYKEKDFETVTAYRAKDGLTDWSDYITLEARKAFWKDLV